MDDEKGEQFGDAAMSAFTKHVDEYLGTYGKLIKFIWDTTRNFVGCADEFAEFSVDSALGWGDSTPTDFNAMAAALVGPCAGLSPVALALAKYQAWDKVLRSNPELVVGAALELMLAVDVVCAEKIADPVFWSLLKKYAGDGQALGQLYGMVAGFLICEIVIDTLLFESAGKAFRSIRFVQ